jgi:hypothetical protein
LTACILIVTLIAAAAIRCGPTLSWFSAEIFGALESSPAQNSPGIRYAPLALLSGSPYQDRPAGEMTIDFLVTPAVPQSVFTLCPATK